MLNGKWKRHPLPPNSVAGIDHSHLRLYTDARRPPVPLHHSSALVGFLPNIMSPWYFCLIYQRQLIWYLILISYHDISIHKTTLHYVDNYRNARASLAHCILAKRFPTIPEEWTQHSESIINMVPQSLCTPFYGCFAAILVAVEQQVRSFVFRSLDIVYPAVVRENIWCPWSTALVLKPYRGFRIVVAPEIGASSWLSTSAANYRTQSFNQPVKPMTHLVP